MANNDSVLCDNWENMKKTIKDIIVIILAYMALTSIVYGFRHPEQTETQRALHIVDSWLWR